MARRRVQRQISTLQDRIAAGLADPISDRERAQLAEIREIYKRRFGRYPDDPPTGPRSPAKRA